MSKAGGISVGPSHDDGGIKFQVAGTPGTHANPGKTVELEGDEIVVCREAYYSDKKLSLEGTPYSILMNIQKMHGCNTGKLEKIERGEYVICKRVVLDHESIQVEGTVRHIVNVLQAMGGCVVDTNGCDGGCDHGIEKKLLGGSIHTTASHRLVAEILKKAGKTPKDIEEIVNVRFGYDKKWRQVISDKNYDFLLTDKKLLKNHSRNKRGYKLSEIIRHPKLFEYYPEFRNLLVMIVASSSGDVADSMLNFIKGKNHDLKSYSIDLDINFKYIEEHGEQEFKPTGADGEYSKEAKLLHEIQHLCQAWDSVDGYGYGRNDAVREYQELLAETILKRESATGTERNTLDNEFNYQIANHKKIVKAKYQNHPSEIEASEVVLEYLIAIGNKNYFFEADKKSFGGPIAAKQHNVPAIETFRDKKRRIRFEIDDSTLIIEDKPVLTLIVGKYHKVQVPLEDILKGWDGYEYYPMLKDVQIIFIYSTDKKYDYIAAYNEINQTIIFNSYKFYTEYGKYIEDYKNHRSTRYHGRNQKTLPQAVCELFRSKLVHELQHAIQYSEGIPGTPSRRGETFRRLKKYYKKSDMLDSNFTYWIESHIGKNIDQIIYNFTHKFASEKEAYETEHRLLLTKQERIQIPIRADYIFQNGGLVKTNQFSDKVFDYLNHWVDLIDEAELKWIDIRDTNWYPTKHFIAYSKDKNFDYGSEVKGLYEKIKSGEKTWPIVVERSVCKTLDENMNLTEIEKSCFSVRDGIHRIAIHEELGKFLIPALIYETRVDSLTRDFGDSFKTKKDFEQWAGTIDNLYKNPPILEEKEPELPISEEVLPPDHYPFYGHVLLNQFESMVKGSPILNESEFCFLKEVYENVRQGVKFHRPALDKIAQKCGMIKFRSIKELTELVYVILYRNIALDQNLSVDEKFQCIVEIYTNQTNLRFGDQDTIMLQQYSTPGPISYLLGQWCLDEKEKVNYPAILRAYKEKVSGSGYKAFKGIGKPSEQYVVQFADLYEYTSSRATDREDAMQEAINYYYPIVQERASAHTLLALEPSAGNGLLTLALDPAMVIVNELDKLRNKSLQLQGYQKIYNEDAAQPLSFIEKNNFDIVLSNPPFGPHEPVEFDGYKLTALEHVMIAYALEKMKPDGKAAFIIGNHTKVDLKGRLVGRDKQFLQFLSKSYQLLDVINVDGSLYGRQGITFPIRVILISGRQKSDTNFPLYVENESMYKRLSPTIIYNFMDLKKRIYG